MPDTKSIVDKDSGTVGGEPVDHDLDKIVKDWDAHLEQRNTMTSFEFHKYKPLFRKDSNDLLSKTDIEALTDEYQSKVSLFHPVKIIDEGTGEVLFILPPVFNQVPSINSLDQLDVTNLMNAFSHAMKLAKSPTSLLPEKMSHTLSMCIDKSIEQSQEVIDRTVDQIDEAYASIEQSDRVRVGEIEDRPFQESELEWQEE